MYPGDASWLDTAGRLLLIAFFLSVGIRNLQAHHVEDHIKRLTNFKAPLPKVTFWVGQSIEFIGCALVLFNWHPAIGVLLLLFFTIVASALLLRFWEVEGPMRTGLQNGMLAKYRHRRRPAAALAAGQLAATRATLAAALNALESRGSSRRQYRRRDCAVAHELGVGAA